MKPCLLIAVAAAVATSAAAAGATRYSDVVLSDKPAAYWRLNDTDGATVLNHAAGANAATLNGTATGKVGLGSPGPSAVQFPEFEPDSVAVEFNGPNSFIRVTDPGASSALDFKKGQSLTLEAWVSLNDLKNGAHAYLVGKGRTGAEGNTKRKNGAASSGTTASKS